MDRTVGISLDDRKDLQRLAEHGEFLGMDRQLAGLGDEGETLDTDDVTDVQQFLEYGVVHRLVFARADLVTLDIDLDASALVLELHERSRTHDAARHDASGDADILEVPFLRLVAVEDLRGGRVDRIKRCRIRFDAQFPELVHGFPSLNLLLTELLNSHNCLLTLIVQK